MFNICLDKISVWRCVQKVGEKIKFDLDLNELAKGQADGTGIPIQRIKKRGKELKVFIQEKVKGGIRIAGLSIGNYDSGWDKLFSPVLETLKLFPSFLLITDGDKINAVIKVKTERLEKLIKYCDEKGLKHCVTYLQNAKPDMFTAFKNKLNGKTTSKVERVMRTVNLKINVGNGARKVHQNSV